MWAFKKKKKKFVFVFCFPKCNPRPPSREAFTLYNSGTSEYTNKKFVRGPTLRLPRWRSPQYGELPFLEVVPSSNYGLMIPAEHS
jgi:hypothetical protein